MTVPGTLQLMHVMTHDDIGWISGADIYQSSSMSNLSSHHAMYKRCIGPLTRLIDSRARSLHNSASMTSTNTQSNYQTTKSALLSFPHDFISLPTSPVPLHIRQKSASTPTIASLSLHPALESALHLLNNDLPSAHFLVRHAQSGPAWECMFLHGILHRIEGDVDNTRCWYGDVKESDVFRHVWGSDAGEERDSGWQELLKRVERWRDSVASRKGSKGKMATQEGLDWEKEEAELRELSLWELKKVVEFIEKKFGTAKLEDSTTVWVQPDKTHADKANAMIVGGEGWREF